MRIKPEGYIPPHIKVRIKVEADYSGDSLKSRDVIVVHADRSVEMNFIWVEESDSPIVAIETICRDSAKQLAVIKLKDALDTKQNFVIGFGSGLSVRDDQKGLYRLGEGWIRANFGNKEARLIMPCFDDPKFKTVFGIDLSTEVELKVSSEILKVNSQIRRSPFDMSKYHRTSFAKTEPISLDGLWFNAGPERNDKVRADDKDDSDQCTKAGCFTWLSKCMFKRRRATSSPTK